MIVVKVELWPQGDEGTAREITRMAIANVSGTREQARYLAVLKGDDGTETQKLVEGHLRSEGVQALIERTIAAPPMAAQPQRAQDHYARDLADISQSMGEMDIRD